MLIFFTTTSIPTPRPESSVTFSFVEKPGSVINWNISLSEYSISLLISPFFLALAKIFSLLSPCPSSSTIIRTLPPSFLAVSLITPFGSLPAAILSSLVSIPWSTEFLMICISGSEIFSIIFLSTSVFSPLITRSISLPSFLAESNTILFIFWNVGLRGIILIDIITSCKSDVIFISCAVALLKFDSSSPGTLRSGFCATTASAITISPIKSISISIFSTFMLINVCLGCLDSFLASFFALPTSLDLIT